MPYLEIKDRVKLYYEVHGKGKPIVFIHGLTANHSHFKYQTRYLKDRFQVIVYDQRGHGASIATDHQLNINILAHDLKALIDYLEIPSVSLVGWSLGTHVIFEFI